MRGSILKRRNADGTITYSIKYRTAYGTQVKKAIGPVRRDAEAALAEAIASVARGEIRTTSHETFAQAAERWLIRKRPVLEASTARDYEAHLRLRLIPAFGDRKLRQITRGHVERYLADLDRKGELSRKTINDSLIPMRQILNRAVRDGVIATNPAANRDRDDPLELPYERPTMHLPQPGRRARVPRCRARLVPAPRRDAGRRRTADRRGHRPGVARRQLGCRRARDLAHRQGRRHRHAQGRQDPQRRDRRVPHRRPTAAPRRAGPPRLDHAPGIHEPHQLPAGPPQRPPPWPRRDLRDAALPANVRLHDLRHTAATLWLASGQSIYFVQQQLGHQDIQTTIDLYGHPDQAAHRRAADNAAAWWRGGASEALQVPPAVPRPAPGSLQVASAPVPAGLRNRDGA